MAGLKPIYSQSTLLASRVFLSVCNVVANTQWRILGGIIFDNFDALLSYDTVLFVVIRLKSEASLTLQHLDQMAFSRVSPILCSPGNEIGTLCRESTISIDVLDRDTWTKSEDTNGALALLAFKLRGQPRHVVEVLVGRRLDNLPACCGVVRVKIAPVTSQ
jgi:hypothetical protein